MGRQCRAACGLPAERWSLALFTPTLAPPPREVIGGLFADWVYV